MIRNIKGSIIYYTFNSFDCYQVTHGFFTRHGGVSPDPWNSLNLGSTVGDSRINILENRKRLFKAINRSEETIFDAWQVHGVNVICTNSPRIPNQPHEKADIIITDNSSVTLLSRFADCVPILLYDPIIKVVAIAHAGWQGTIKKIAKIAVTSMNEKYGCKTMNIIAGIGPSIGPDVYQIKEDVISSVMSNFPNNYSSFLNQKDGFVTFDLWKSNEFVLKTAGVENIEIGSICTASNINDWYSYRRESGNTGRFAAVIALNR